MNIKFTDLYKLASNKKQLFSKISYLIKNSKFVGGEEVGLFEKNFSQFSGSNYCVSVANGTDALEIAIKSLNLRKGSEIIVPNNTWISTAEAVFYNIFKFFFFFFNINDYTIDLKDLEKKINKKTAAIIAVHLYGNPADIIGIKKIVKNRKIKIVEDCAQAHGAYINNKHVGTFGDIGTFSFFPGKNLGAFGDGGAIITNSKKIKDYCLRMRNHGAMKKYDHSFSGRNSRLDTIQAGILNIKLKTYNKVIARRLYLAKLYFKELKILNKINKLNLFQLNKKNQSAFHQFVIRTKYKNQLEKFLNKSGIETMIHYPYMLNELKFFNYNKKLKNSYKLGSKILSLPISEEHKKNEIIYICKKIKSFFNEK